jgi:hypothetical protein
MGLRSFSECHNLILGGKNMEIFTEYLAQIDNPQHRLNSHSQRNELVGKLSGIPIYFYRCIGTVDNEEGYVKRLVKLQEKLKKSSST